MVAIFLIRSLLLWGARRRCLGGRFGFGRDYYGPLLAALLRGGRWRRKRLDEGDQLNNLLLAQLALKVRHDIRLEAADDLGVRIENRFPYVGIVRDDRTAVV